ncbi:hypothetical protein ACFCX4_26185 [Kitasatospora sp. NPDC056327]|uniref:hypothetical protein n=1 Tax=Kitasatospora sp. NPDC056327 TaxID=3345785 RepID=UPI0035D988C4
MNLCVVLDGDRLRVPASAFAPAGGEGERVVPVSALRDADPGTAPPEIRTLAGESLFLPATRRADLEEFCAANGIPLRRRPDVWGDLLEPFLDTAFTTAHREAAQARLTRVGLGEGKVAAIRAEVGPMMVAYNSVHRDWCHLGLADLLDAATSGLVPEEHRVGRAGLAAFHAWAMEIADLGRPHTV